jgi:Methane oxygenase PmoA
VNCLHRCLAGIALLAVAHPASAQSQTIAEFDVKNTNAGQQAVCVPLNLPPEIAKLTNVTVVQYHQTPVQGKAIGGGGGFATVEPGQLTVPGLLTNSLPGKEGMLRRDLHFIGPAGEDYRVKVYAEDFKIKAKKSNDFAWQDKPGEYADLTCNGKGVLRYVYKAYDNSTAANRDKTYKVFHHLYDSTGKRFLTNGGDTNDPMPKNPKDSLYPHHRGLMYAFNIITYGGNKPCDTWHAKPGDTHQSHDGFLDTEAGSVLGRHRVAVNWHGPKNDVFAKEEREITVYKIGNGTLVEFASRLKTVAGPIKLAGDPLHAGFQFRAHNDVHEQKMDKQTYYLRPDGKGALGDTRNWEPKSKQGPINLLWDAGSFVIDGKRFSVAYLNNPKNPGESRWSERDYGRFGCYFEYDLTEDRPLVVNYRVWLQDGEMTGEQVQALSKAFVEPPRVAVK